MKETNNNAIMSYKPKHISFKLNYFIIPGWILIGDRRPKINLYRQEEARSPPTKSKSILHDSNT